MASLMALRHVPDEHPDEIAHVVMQFADVDQPDYRLSSGERADIPDTKADIERGDLATDEEVRAIWA